MRSVVAIGLAVCLTAPAFARADELKTALTKLQERYESTKTFTAEFRQIIESPTLAGTIESRGKLAFEKPNRMRWDYDPPDRQIIVGDGETLWIYQPDEKQVIKAPLSEAFQARTPVSFLGGLGHVDREFDATLEKDDPARWLLRLVSKQDKGFGTLRLSVRKSDAAIEEARITDTLGTTTRLLLTGEKRNVTLEPTLFRFTPPPGVDVVKPPAY